MPGENGKVNSELCEQRYNELTGKYEFVFRQLNNLEGKMDKGFEKLNTRIDNAEKGMIKILWSVLRWVVLALLGTMGFIAWQFAQGNLKV